MSVQDRRFLKKLTEGIRQHKDGYFELPLPFKEDDVILPNNRHMAHKLLGRLRHRLLKDERYRKDYCNFMQEVITKGYAVKVPADEVSREDGRVWYIPHHGVYHPRKPGKIRVVNNCSAMYKGDVLNRHLLQGPDLINSLVGVLLRFRQERHAFTCDIQAMFHQVRVRPEDQDYLRLLWWENGDLNTNPSDYRMTVHLFGATS